MLTENEKKNCKDIGFEEETSKNTFGELIKKKENLSDFIFNLKF